MIRAIWKDVLDIDVPADPRMPYAEAMQPLRQRSPGPAVRP
jgi:hypothetical protein